MEIKDFLKEQVEKCQRFDKAYKEKHEFNEESCPPFFDDILCWPSINASQIITQSCPLMSIMGHTNATIQNLREYMKIDRSCQSDGEWHIEYLWRGYTICVPNSAFYVIDSTDEVKYSWYPEEVLLFIEWFPILTSISYVGYVTSFGAMILAMTILSLFKRFRNPTNRFHMHLFATFMMKALITLTKYWSILDGVGLMWEIVLDTENNESYAEEYDDSICKLLRVLSNYFVLTNYSWMLMEGLYLYNLMTLKITVGTSMTSLYIFLGWGLPFLIIVPWLAIWLIIPKSRCWAIHEDPSLFSVIRVPIMISIVVNFMLFLYIVRMMWGRLRASLRQQQRRMEYKKWARPTVILIPSVGVCYFFLFGLSHVEDYNVKLVWLFAHQLLASFQGTVVALVLCLLKDDVRKEIQRAWETRSFKIPFLFAHRDESNSQKEKDDNKQHLSEVGMKESPL